MSPGALHNSDTCLVQLDSATHMHVKSSVMSEDKLELIPPYFIPWKSMQCKLMFQKQKRILWAGSLSHQEASQGLAPGCWKLPAWRCAPAQHGARARYGSFWTSHRPKRPERQLLGSPHDRARGRASPAAWLHTDSLTLL